MKKDFRNLIELVEFFKTEEDCIIYLKSIFWKNEKYCPHCGSNKVMEFENIKRNRCKECKKDFSIIKGTIFEDSNITLKKWFMASYLFNAHKKGISSCQLAKDIGVSQPTAWFMLQRLRHASIKSSNQKFQGICEVDEAYLGGKEENRHMQDRLQGKKDKAVIIGIINRENKQVKTIKVNDAKANTLQKEIYSNIKNESTLITDEHKAYQSISHFIYNHKTINHSRGE